MRETSLAASHLIAPLFIMEGDGRQPIPSMPGVERLSLAALLEQGALALDSGLAAVALFAVIDPSLKDERGGEAVNENNLICRGIRALKKNLPELAVIADAALDPFTSHGHDGIVIDGEVANDATVAALCAQALALAKAGADVVAPSDMMDGRIGAIRKTLDDAGFERVLLLSYAVKYASSFYGPFRDAVGSAASLGGASKAGYQMDIANAREGLREAALDIDEGADMLMVKPGLPYLDVLALLKQQFALPLLAYQVSGEYAMLKAAAQQGWLDYRSAMLESLLALRRAGASGVLTYAAFEAAAWLNAPHE